MDKLHTIGHTKKSLEEFITRLKSARVDCVVDIRLNNTSQLAGFSKKDDLDFLLSEGFGIRYVHLPEFAPDDDLLSNYKSGKDWSAYEDGYAGLIEERDMVDTFLRLAQEHRWERPCLLCSEDTPDKCHRRLLAEAIRSRVNALEVIHL